MAFSASEDLRHRILCVLDGVGVPMASAVLTVWDPDRFTVYDVRATEALEQLGEEASGSGYVAYRRHCLELADGLNVELRDLDRAVWKWSQNKMPRWA